MSRDASAPRIGPASQTLSQLEVRVIPAVPEHGYAANFQVEGVSLDYVNNMMPVIRGAAWGVTPIRAPVVAVESAAMPVEISNAPGFAGAPHVPVGEHAVRLTEADGIIAALYCTIVKHGNLSTINADLEKLNRVMAGSSTHGDTDHQQRISNIYLGKALNILCQLVRGRGVLSWDDKRLLRAARACTDVIAARQEFTLENLGVIMFHLGELLNDPKLEDACLRTITDHLVPIFETTLRAQPAHTIEGATVAFGLVSALRASEHQLTRMNASSVSRPAADSLLLALPDLLQRRPDLLATLETRTLAMMAKYGVQYLRQLARPAWRHGPPVPCDSLQRNAARAVKLIIEEARILARGVWDQRCAEYHGFTANKPRDNLAYSAFYYCRWLTQQPERVQARFALQEAERGPLPDNPRDERGYAEVVRLGVDVATMEAGVINAPAPPDGDIADEVCMAAEPSPPEPDLARFNAVAGALVRYGENADHIDREDAIAAVNTLVASIESGRTVLTQAQRVQMLLNMDAVCRQLATASPQPSHYAWQLGSMRGFLSTQLAQVVGTNGKPLMAADLPDTPGLSAWQRSLLVILNSCEGDR